MIVSLNINSSVVSLALSSVSLMGAGLAPAVLVRVLGLRHSGTSLSLSVVTGLVVALAWRAASFGGVLNEAAPGILAGRYSKGRWTSRSFAAAVCWTSHTSEFRRLLPVSIRSCCTRYTPTAVGRREWQHPGRVPCVRSEPRRDSRRNANTFPEDCKGCSFIRSHERRLLQEFSQVAV